MAMRKYWSETYIIDLPCAFCGTIARYGRPERLDRETVRYHFACVQCGLLQHCDVHVSEPG